MVFAEKDWNFNKKSEFFVTGVDEVMKEIKSIWQANNFPPMTPIRERDIKEMISRLQKDGEKAHVFLSKDKEGNDKKIFINKTNEGYTIKLEGI